MSQRSGGNSIDSGPAARTGPLLRFTRVRSAVCIADARLAPFTAESASIPAPATSKNGKALPIVMPPLRPSSPRYAIEILP